MDNISWKSWAFQACAHIRFKPDRAAVEEELLAHLEDKAEAILREKELTVYEAERQALASMGDADEVGRQLAAVYRPWLGYLWLWSRRVLIVCVVAAVWLSLGFSQRVGFGESDLRWWHLADIGGRGLTVTSDAPFSASALHYQQESLDEGPAKRQGHSPEVEKQKNVSVCLDKVQYGLACVNSWGALPLPEYRIPYADYTFRLKIAPATRL